MIVNLLIFVVSLIVLLKASDYFVEAAEKIGLNLGIPQFIVGATIIAFGTSLPELASSIASIYIGESEIVVGNVIGSNIANILLVLGIVAFFGKQIILNIRVRDVEIPLLIASALFLWFMLKDQNFSITEAIILIAALVIFLLNSIKGENTEPSQKKSKTEGKTIFLLIISALFVYLGAKYTIDSIKEISLHFGISTNIIALTVVAFGTSLPELIVSLSAIKKGNTSMAIGNVIGSNIFNSFAVMSIPRLFGELEIPAGVVDFSLPFMLCITILLGFICVSHKISRWEGAIMVILYVFYIIETMKFAA